MAICNHLATTVAPHRTQFLLLAALLIPTIVCAADFTGRVVGIIDGDTLEVLHNNHAERIRLPQSQRHSKERRDPLNRKNREAHILACHQLSCALGIPQNQTRQPTEHGE
jgi:hypothetical protein